MAKKGYEAAVNRLLRNVSPHIAHSKFYQKLNQNYYTKCFFIERCKILGWKGKLLFHKL